MVKFICCTLLLLLSTLIGSVKADSLQLTLPVRENYPYMEELVIKSLQAQGHQVHIHPIKNIPTQRVMKMLASGQLSLYWRGYSPELDAQFTPVKIGLTQGLKGHRVLFIPKGHQHHYDSVQSLADFQALGKTAGFGKNWTDTIIWRHNKLRAKEIDGNWAPALYRMTAKANRGIDYFSRGIIEMALEQKNHPQLDVEQKLMLVYDQDFIFYLSNDYRHLQPLLYNALKAAQDSGLMQKLLRKHFLAVYDPEGLNFEGRKKLYLQMPY